MRTYTFKATLPGSNDWSLTLEANEEHSLADLDAVLRNELQTDLTAPCAFFMSGDESDESTAFVGAPGAGTTARLRLGAANLEAGMQIAYVPHPQSPIFSLKLEQVGEGAQAKGAAPRANERTGSSPELPTFDASELERGLESASHDCGCSHGECGCGEHECGSDCGCGCEPARHGCHESAPSPEEERKRQEARASFPAELIEKLEAALDLTEQADDSLPPELLPALENALEACDDAAALERLSTAVDAAIDHLSRNVIDDLAGPPSTLVRLARRLAQLTGTAEDQSLVVRSLTMDGKHGEALAALDALPVRSRLGADWKSLERANIQMLADDSAGAESTLRGLLANQWLSGNLRPRAVDLLIELLGNEGRELEARQVTQVEKAHHEKLEALRTMTFERPGKKVSPNDRCPCGSGRKYKKCCGMPA